MPPRTASQPTDSVIARANVLLPDAPADSVALWLWTWRAGRIVETFTREQLTEDGIDMSEFVVLFVLWFSGKPYRSTQADLARDVVLTQSGIVRALQRATRNGTINKIRHPDDGRTQIIELTDRGRELVERTMSKLLENFDERTGKRGSAEVRRLADSAFEIAAAVEGPRNPLPLGHADPAW
jgi:DNA-binding MarR family transcriptional regulator